MSSLKKLQQAGIRVKLIWEREALIEDDAWVGANSMILRGATLGEGCIVGAGAVVTKDVPAWTIVAGNTAKVIRELEPDER